MSRNALDKYIYMLFLDTIELILCAKDVLVFYILSIK